MTRDSNLYSPDDKGKSIAKILTDQTVAPTLVLQKLGTLTCHFLLLQTKVGEKK